MRPRLIMAILLSLSFTFSHAQNENEKREAFTLKLPIDEKQYYEQKIESSPYFVNEKVLQIYPGENLFIEVEIDKMEITSLKVVKENLHPEKTLEIELTQTVKDNSNEKMMLKVVNPFDKNLEYKAMMFIVGHDKWIHTNVLPVIAKLTGYEIWNDVINTLVLTDWKLN